MVDYKKVVGWCLDVGASCGSEILFRSLLVVTACLVAVLTLYVTELHLSADEARIIKDAMGAFVLVIIVMILGMITAVIRDVWYNYHQDEEAFKL